MQYWTSFRLVNYQGLWDFLKHESAHLSNYFKAVFPTHWKQSWSFFLTLQLHHISIGDGYFPFISDPRNYFKACCRGSSCYFRIVCFPHLPLSQFGVALCIEMFLQLMTTIFYNKVLSAWLNQVLWDQLHLEEVALCVEGAVGKSNCRWLER